ncbi:2-oxo acid dehydrogenase subunit E2 [Pseudomonas sp. P115]|uniref:dihydrolipoamide acetyltransferase family protein n=1 Tax=Pseudomonas pisciculturae TaxID=2730413 RepID=UPI00189271B7|nr:2-oxo acid dehydrogenase subunit E2 [Pseudomonas pisciculturae]MBF6029764.1 2-oxo acid dehydrogenase subunit E2 [Pseudomonas pisciculturae]
MNDMTIKPGSLNIIAPLEQEGTKAVVRTWLRKTGDTVRKHEPVVELETDKVVVEIAAPADGTLEIILREDADAEPGAVLGVINAGGVQEPSAPVLEPLIESPADSSVVFDPELRLSPAVRRLLREHNVAPTAVAATGRGGRLTREDVLAFVQAEPVKQALSVPLPAPKPQAKAVPAPATKAQAAPSAVVPASGERGPRVSAHVPHSSMRRKIAEHMQHSVSTAPHVTSVFEADFSAIIAHRKKNKKLYADQDVNLTFTTYFVAASVQAMLAVPNVNSRWHDDYLEVFKDISIGIGTALGETGLIVPVIQRAQELNILGIASRLQELTMAARNGKLKAADVQGGTFTISNHGTSGSLFASPIIINQPQSAILGIGALEKRVVVREVDGVDSFQVRPKAYVSLTIDHRVLDGSVTNAWLSRFVEVIENWPLEG